MARAKLYTSEMWLRGEYLIKRRTIDEIAARCGVSHNTIRTALKNFGLLR